MKYQQYEFDYHQMKQIVNYAIEQFETLLDKYNIILPNPEKEGAGEGTSNIFGTDHGNLMDNITFEIEDVFDFDVNSDNVEKLPAYHNPVEAVSKSTAINFAGFVINEFENVLDRYNINIPNPDKAEAANPANIFGEDYFLIEDGILGIIQEDLGITIEDEQA